MVEDEGVEEGGNEEAEYHGRASKVVSELPYICNLVGGGEIGVTERVTGCLQAGRLHHIIQLVRVDVFPEYQHSKEWRVSGLFVF